MLSPCVGDGSEEMELTESYKNPEIVSENLMHKYKFMEVRQAAAVLSASCPAEWRALCDYLSDFVLATDHLMQPGGNKSEVVKAWENFFMGMAGLRHALIPSRSSIRFRASARGCPGRHRRADDGTKAEAAREVSSDRD